MTIVPPATALFDGTIPASGSADVNFSLTYDRTYYVEVNGTLHTATAALWTQEDINLTAVPVGGGETPEVPVEPPDPDEPPAFLGVMTALTVEDVTIITSDSQNGVIEAPAGTVVRVYANDPTMTDVAYIRGLNLIASRTDEAITYYHYNAHGDVVQLTDANGNIIRDYTYDAFGVEQNAAGGDANPFRYCGEQFDAETGTITSGPDTTRRGQGGLLRQIPTGTLATWSMGIIPGSGMSTRVGWMKPTGMIR